MNRNWKEALALMGIVSKDKPKMLFEKDDVNGKKLIFPDANDITEVVEGASVTAEDGEYVIEADGMVHTLVVAGGKIESMTHVEAKSNEEKTEMSAETVELLQAFAEQFESNATMIASLQEEIKGLKSLMKHAPDNQKDPNPTMKIAGKTIDLTKLNLK